MSTTLKTLLAIRDLVSRLTTEPIIREALHRDAAIGEAAKALSRALSQCLAACADERAVWTGSDPWTTIATGHVLVQASDLRKVLDHLHGEELQRMAPELDDYEESAVHRHVDAIERFMFISQQTTGVTLGSYFNRHAC